MDQIKTIAYPENYQDLCAECGDSVKVIPRGTDVSTHDIAMVVKKINSLLEPLVQSVQESDIDYNSILSVFFKKICDVDHLYSDVSHLNMLIGALNSTPISYRQIWVAIMLILSNRIVPFSHIPQLDVSQRFTRSRKCPSLTRDEEGHIIFHRPQFVTGDVAVYELVRSLVPCDEERVVEGKTFEMPGSNQWYVIIDEFHALMKNGIATYKEGDKTTIHNLLVGMALRKYPMAKKLPYQALVKSLGAQLRTQLSIDEQNLLELINSALNLKKFEIGSKSLVDASYIIDKSLPTVMYKATENGKSVTKVRQYQPFGWHKVPEQRTDRSGTRTLPDYARVTVLARDCALAWNNILSDLSKIKLDETKMRVMTQNVRSWISISQRLRKDWYLSLSSKVIERLEVIKSVTPYLPKYIDTDQYAITSAEKGDYSLLSALLAVAQENN
jgi:hypothetical protein